MLSQLTRFSMTDEIVLKTGVVKFYSLAAGYGFIVDDETGGDIFVHVENLKKSDLVELNKGDKVSFLQNKKGSRFYASQIKLL
jgi:CspA family cold shock protein